MNSRPTLNARRAVPYAWRVSTSHAQRGSGSKAQRGVMLLEVLISVLIFSIGLLGLVALQARAHQFSMSAEDTNRAALLANDIASAMQVRQAASVPDDVYAAWQARVANAPVDGLPNGIGKVDTSASPATITITWQSPSAKAGATANRFVTQVTVP